MSEWLFPAGVDLGIYLAGLGLAAALMVAVWALSVWRRDASIVDPFWGTTITALGWYYVLAAGSPAATSWIALLLVTAWGGRLSVYLALRRRGEPEDFRYRAMRDKHGDRFAAVSLVTVFLLQALLAWVVSAPLFQAAAGRGGPGAVGWVGAGVAAVGLAWETVADAQLWRFRSRRRGPDAVLHDGLWRYSRHPNYFGEFVFWWGMFLLAASTGGFVWSVVGPVLMTVLLLRVSGVPLLEEKLARRPDFRRYARTTNAFFPWRPRSVAPEGEAS